MLANVELAAVIALVGQERLSTADRIKACDYFGVKFDGDPWSATIVASFGNSTIGALMRKHETMWLTVSDCRDPGFGHACLLHKGELYDPMYGHNPQWIWSHYVSTAKPVFAKE